MRARNKLNQAHINGAVIVGIVLGGVTESWTIFWVAILYGLASSIHDGGIHLADRGRKR